jgi:hypothetical protein
VSIPDFDDMTFDEAAEWMDANGHTIEWVDGELEVSPNLKVTRGGTPLTDEYVQKLANEAEAGYDVDKLVPRKITPL